MQLGHSNAAYSRRAVVGRRSVGRCCRQVHWRSWRWLHDEACPAPRLPSRFMIRSSLSRTPALSSLALSHEPRDPQPSQPMQSPGICRLSACCTLACHWSTPQTKSFDPWFQSPRHWATPREFLFQVSRSVRHTLIRSSIRPPRQRPFLSLCPPSFPSRPYQI